MLRYLWEGEIEFINHFLRIGKFFEFSIKISIWSLSFLNQFKLVRTWFIRIVYLSVLIWFVWIFSRICLRLTYLNLLINHLHLQFLFALYWLTFHYFGYGGYFGLNHDIDGLVYNIKFLYFEFFYWRRCFIIKVLDWTWR